MTMTFSEAVVVGLLLVLVALGVLLLFRRPPREPDGRALAAQSAAAAEWDRRLATVPQHADLRGIIERLNTVERVCDVVRAELGGVKDAVGRVEKMTNMLLAQQLEGKA